MTEFPATSGIFSHDDWMLAKRATGQTELIVRMRSSLPSDADQELFSTLIIITWVYEGNEFGMPVTDDHLLMQALEDALEHGTERREVAYQALALTGNGKKEWRYYSKDSDTFLGSLNDDLVGHPRYPIEITSFQDPDWTALREYLFAVGPDH